MVVTIFRSRLRDDVPHEFDETAERLGRLAAQMPGFIEYKVFQAEDGERATLVRFETAEDQRRWREQAEHAAAQRRGRERFYASYSVETFESETPPRHWER